MNNLRLTYTVKGISHHDVADKLAAWLPTSVGRMVTLGLEAAEENEIGVECVAVYDVDEHIGYIDDNQKHDLLTLLKRSRRPTLRSHIVAYDEGKGEQAHWHQAKLIIEAPKLKQNDLFLQDTDESLRKSPWADWDYQGPLVPRTAVERKLETVTAVIQEMMEENEIWSSEIKDYLDAFCRNAIIDLSCEMRQDMLRFIAWLEGGESEEMRQMSDHLLAVMTNMGSEELRALHVQQLITEKTLSPGCQSILKRTNFDIEYVKACHEAMPYSMEWYIGDEAAEKRFVAKLYYDNTLTRQKLQKIYSVIVLKKRWEIEQANLLTIAEGLPRVVSMDALSKVIKGCGDRKLAGQIDLLIRKALNEDITREDIRILNTIDAAYCDEEKEQKEDAKLTAEAIKGVAGAIRENPPHIMADKLEVMSATIDKNHAPIHIGQQNIIEASSPEAEQRALTSKEIRQLINN